MSYSKIRVYGIEGEVLNSEGESPFVTSGETYGRFELERIIYVSESMRDVETHAVDIEVNGDQVLEYNFDDGTVWYSDPVSIKELFPDASSQFRDSGEIMVLPDSISGGVPGERGPGVKKIVLKILKVFTRRKKEEIIGELVRKAATNLEDKALFEGREGLVRVSEDYTLTRVTASDIPTDGRILLLIHGMANSTKGSFDGLIEGNPPFNTWEDMHRLFPGRVFGFDHRSLTKSPLENVLDLVNALPDRVTLHLMTQSRGGLVADLLCRFVTAARQSGNGETVKAFDDEELELLKKDKLEKDLSDIREITARIAAKDIRIEKYIRVSCPAGGTTLASRRLDFLLNVIFNLLKLATGQVGGIILGALKELVITAVETKDDPAVLPGLAPQNPESALCLVLNNPKSKVEVDIPTAIVAGDNQFSFKLRGLLNIVSNLFYRGANDFVVDTKYMLMGTRRGKDNAVYFLDKHDEVTHFNYFKNSTSQAAIRNALNAHGTNIPGFLPVPAESTLIARTRGGGRHELVPREISKKRPVVVLVPGLFGSNLSVRTIKDDQEMKEPVWLDPESVSDGKLELLKYKQRSSHKVTANSLVFDVYADLCQFLSEEYDVLVFPYDWRLDMEQNAGKLDRVLVGLAENGQSVKLIGHSSGGVLIRDWTVFHPNTYAKMTRLPDFRILYLGAPLQGLFRVVPLIFGEDDIIRQLTVTDLHHTKKELAALFAGFPGLLDLLPYRMEEGGDFGQSSVWEIMRQACGDPKWPVPDSASLERFNQYRNKILQAPIDYEYSVYLAGIALEGTLTPCNYKISPRSMMTPNVLTLHFEGTPLGDGFSAWEAAIPQELLENGRVYYAEVPHGELVREESLFLPISELLRNGKSTLLPKQAPTAFPGEGAGAGYGVTRQLATTPIDNSSEGFYTSILGLYPPGQREKAERRPVRVSITHGDLRFAKYPLLIGHFANDGLFSASRDVDRYLNFELSRLRKLGLYPGPVGTSLILLANEDFLFPGVIVVGLGVQGEYNERVLQTTVEQGVKKYLVVLIQERKNQKLQTIPDLGRFVNLSSLLIGSNYGGLSLDRSLAAILTGIQNANSDIKQGYPDDYLQIGELEFVELYQDQVLAASRTLREMERMEENRNLFVRLDRKIREAMGRQQRINNGGSGSWWSRVTVRRFDEKDNVAEARKHGLYFSIATDAARVEERSLLTAGDEILSMLKEVSEEKKWSPETAKILFEMLIPNDFKSLVKRQSNIIFQLDEHTASFPWEMLQDNLVNGKPLSINCGMIRQLSSQNYRVQVKLASGNHVLVISDPQLHGKLPQLDNAEKEGYKVSQQLQNGGYNVVHVNRSSSQTIFRKMFVSSYKILHIAAHGLFDEANPLNSGVVIGPNSFLTPAHIECISETPELVFINCCYSGKTTEKSEALAQNRYRLAANIGTQLIRIGVKAVVVGGWAVHDAAALLFAERFYEAMLSGEMFGDAVLRARRQVFDRFGNSNNTWGAYQCYGDPSYKLDIREERSKGMQETVFEMDEVLIIHLRNLLSQIDITEDTAEILSRIQIIEASLTEAQRNNGQIIELIAQIYTALGDFPRAVDHYSRLKSLPHAHYSVRSLEQHCQLQVKWQVERWRADPACCDEVGMKIGEVLNELEELQKLGKTAERYTLLASCRKRLALVTSDRKQKAEGYLRSAELYREGYKISPPGYMHYPLSNFMLIESVLKKEKPEDWDECAAKLSRELIRFGESSRDDYWSQVSQLEIPLYLHLMNIKPSTEEAFITTAEKLRKHTGHRSNWKAIADQLYFLEDLFGMTGNGTDTNKHLSLIRKVRERIG